MYIRYNKSLAGFLVIIIFIFAYIIHNIPNPKILTIFGLSLDALGAFLIAFFSITVDFWEKHGGYMDKITFLEWDACGSFKNFEMQMIIIGLLFLLFGYMVQVYTNLIQLK